MEATVVHRPTSRLVFAGLTGLALAALAVELARHGGYWPALAGGLGPDLALLLGAGAGLQRGQLHPRAVGLYNALHRFWGPLALGALAATGLLPRWVLAGALAWGLHVVLDRTVGYGLRTRDGFQRP